MGDRHGGCFARRGRSLSHPAVVFRWRALVFRWRGVVGRICPARECSLGEGLPTRRTSERICPARERSPRRKSPDTAHERKDLPRARALPSAKASRHSARAKGFAPRENVPLGEGLPTRRTGERICPAQKHSPRRRPPDTAHGRKNLPRAGTLPTAKASRHGARAKEFAPRGFAFAPRADERRAAPDRRTAGKTPLRRGRTRHGARAKGFARAETRPTAKASRHGAQAKGFAPRENAPLGEGLPTRRTSERICPAQKHSPRRRPPDTAHERKDLPREVHVRPTCRRTAGRPRPTNSRKNTPSAGSHPRGRGRCRVHSPKKNKTTP